MPQDDHPTPPIPSRVATALVFIIAVTGTPTLINFLGIYIGTAYLFLMGLPFSLDANTNATLSTNSTNQTNQPHPICGSTTTNYVNPNGAAEIALLCTSISFGVFTLLCVAYKGYRLQEPARFKKSLENSTYFAIGANVGIAAFLIPIIAFIRYCFSMTNALLLALASFLGAATIMIMVGLTYFCGDFIEKCCSAKKAEEDNTATPTTSIAVRSQRLSDASLTSFGVPPSQNISGSFAPISPASQRSEPPINPMEAPNRSPRQPGHNREVSTGTVAFVDDSSRTPTP